MAATDGILPSGALDRNRAACEVCFTVVSFSDEDLDESEVDSAADMMRCFDCGAVICSEHDYAGVQALIERGVATHERAEHAREMTSFERAVLHAHRATLIREQLEPPAARPADRLN